MTDAPTITTRGVDLELPTYTQVWFRLSVEEQRRLDDIESRAAEILRRLRADPGCEADLPLLADLQVDRLHVYRSAAARLAAEGARERRRTPLATR